MENDKDFWNSRRNLLISSIVILLYCIFPRTKEQIDFWIFSINLVDSKFVVCLILIHIYVNLRYYQFQQEYNDDSYSRYIDHKLQYELRRLAEADAIAKVAASNIDSNGGEYKLYTITPTFTADGSYEAKLEYKSYLGGFVGLEIGEVKNVEFQMKSDDVRRIRTSLEKKGIIKRSYFFTAFFPYIISVISIIVLFSKLCLDSGTN